MSIFNIYAYQFKPVTEFVQYSLFSDVIAVRQELMERKNTIFQENIKDTKYLYRGRGYSVNYCLNEENMIIFQIANKRKILVERQFRKETALNEPSIFVIIDNRADVQRIAIQQNQNAFSDTDIVAKILNHSYLNVLSDKDLKITIKREFKETDFWAFVDEHKTAIQKVRFTFDYPNLPRVSEKINKLIKSISINTQSASTVFELNAEDGLLLSPQNEQVSDLNKAASESGNPIICKIRGYKKFVKTGTTTKSIELSDIEMQFKNIDELKTLIKSLT